MCKLNYKETKTRHWKIAKNTKSYGQILLIIISTKSDRYILYMDIVLYYLV